MRIGEAYYCRKKKDGVIKVIVARIKRFSNDRSTAILTNGDEINSVTGKQLGGEKSFWYPYKKFKDSGIDMQVLGAEAQEWFKKMISVNEIAINMYRELRKTTSIDTRAYFHLLKKETTDAMCDMDIGYLKKHFKGPDWCYNSNALNGCLGCKALLLNRINRPSDCFFCRYYINPHTDKYRRLRMVAGLTIPFCNKMLGISDYAMIESGERPPTLRELNIMEAMFNINNWTLKQARAYLITSSGKNVKQDTFSRDYGNIIRKNININQLEHEKKTIRFSSWGIYR